MIEWGLKFYIKHSFGILTMSGRDLIIKLSLTLWEFMVDNWFQYKNNIFNHHSHNCFLSNYFIGLSKLFFDGKRLNDIDFRLKVFFKDFWQIILIFFLLICLDYGRFTKKNSVHYIPTAMILVPNFKVYFNLFCECCFVDEASREEKTISLNAIECYECSNVGIFEQT